MVKMVDGTDAVLVLVRTSARMCDAMQDVMSAYRTSKGQHDAALHYSMQNMAAQHNEYLSALEGLLNTMKEARDAEVSD